MSTTAGDVVWSSSVPTGTYVHVYMHMRLCGVFRSAANAKALFCHPDGSDKIRYPRGSAAPRLAVTGGPGPTSGLNRTSSHSRAGGVAKHADTSTQAAYNQSSSPNLTTTRLLSRGWTPPRPRIMLRTMTLYYGTSPSPSASFKLGYAAAALGPLITASISSSSAVASR